MPGGQKPAVKVLADGAAQGRAAWAAAASLFAVSCLCADPPAPAVPRVGGPGPHPAGTTGLRWERERGVFVP